MSITHEALAFFLALFGLYSPVAALSSYLPIVRPYSHAEQLRLAIGLAVNALVFVLLAVWVGEPLLVLLGISVAALTATGGVALIFASVPLMRGVGEAETTEAEATEAEATGATEAEATGATGAPDAGAVVRPRQNPRSVLFFPLTFPLTVGGTTF